MPDGRPQFSFTDFQVHHPQAPPPGDKLDSEIARLDRVAAEISSLAAKSLNSDGSLRSGTVGKTQLQPGLFDDIAAPEALAAKHGAEEASAAARTSTAAAIKALAAVAAAEAGNALAQAAAHDATSAAREAAASALAAANAADDVEAFYVETGNAAKDTAGDVATCQAYADVTYAWAEHMPDPIPPNILAVMGITGDHWSSRWWANRAAQIVQSIGASGPIDDVTGSGTLPIGAQGVVNIRNGTTAPITITLPAASLAGQTLKFKDAAGNAGTYPITISAAPATIDGNPSYRLMSDYMSLEVYWMGDQWGTR